jgi:hypothetical protein
MKILFVTPNTGGTGEAITALHMAERLDTAGFRVGFLASGLTAPFLTGRFGEDVFTLGDRAEGDDGRWQSAADRFAAELIVFADYPLLYASGQGMAVVRSGWIERARDRGAVLATLDHLGMAQRSGLLYSGPPHLGFRVQRLPPLPDGMHLLLPCPVHEPAPVTGRLGTPFRYRDLPLQLADGVRSRTRARYLRSDDELLVFHSVSGWAMQYARLHGLPHYRCLSHLLEAWLAPAPRPVTVISVNDGRLLGPSTDARVRFVDLDSLPRARYDELLLSADLMITDNQISVSLGTAVCGLVPCIALRNSLRLAELAASAEPAVRELVLGAEAERSGAVFPFEVFPLWGRQELETLGLAEHGCAAAAAARLELYGGERSAARVLALLTDERAREEQLARQRSYCRRLEALPGPVEAVERLTAAGRGRAGRGAAQAHLPGAPGARLDG